MTKSTYFRQRIRAALSDPDLQNALDGNADRRQQAFTQAYASLPETLPVMRQRAHSVRAETITNLDAYLEQFIVKARANGLTVHRAADAAQAIKIVRQIAGQVGAQIIVVNKDPGMHPAWADIVFNTPAAETLPKLVENL